MVVAADEINDTQDLSETGTGTDLFLMAQYQDTQTQNDVHRRIAEQACKLN
jgi:hypothetical protein